MIGGVVRHGRTARDARNLGRHLLKDSPTVEIVNSAAPDLDTAMADMMLARDASRADAAFLHIYLSPSRDMSRDELRQAVEIAAEHLGAADHPMALVYHEKPRRSGEGNGHVHAVIGRIGPEGDVLPSGFDKIKLETACRLIEYEMGEAPTLGRHHKSAVRWLRQNGRVEAADWLEAAHGPEPEKPRSMTSPDKRQALERQGVDHGHIRDAVAAAWSASDSPKAFAAAMSAEGLTIMPGQKAGVWIVRHGEQEIGALDRIVKERRKAVAQRMEGFENGTDAGEEGRPERTHEAETPSGTSEGSHGIEAAPSPLGGTGAEGRRPDRADSKHPGNDLAGPAPFAFEPRRPAQQAGHLERAQAVRQLSQVRLSPAAIEAAQEIRIRAHRPVTLHESLQATRQIQGASGTRWAWLRHLADLLRNRARLTLDAVMRYRQEQKAAAEKTTEWEPEKFGIADALAREKQRTYTPGPKFGRSRKPEYVYSGPRM